MAILWADDRSGYLSLDAGVVARDASGRLVDTLSIVAVPVGTITSHGEIGAIEHPRLLYAYDCTPDGVTFTPASTLTFTLTEEEWGLYGDHEEVGWFNSITGEWEIIAGVPDAGQRTITIPVTHFSTYALFAEYLPSVPLPDVTKSADSSDGSSPWLWLLIGAVVVVGGILFISRRKDDSR